MKPHHYIAPLAVSLLLCACQDQKTPPPQATPTPTPVATPTPEPTPQISQQTKDKIISLIQATSKLMSMIEQGVSLPDYKNQLAEVRSIAEALELVGWPKDSERTQRCAGFSLEGWVLAQDIWNEQIRLQSQSSQRAKEEYFFFKYGGAEKMFGSRFRAHEKNLDEILELKPEIFSPADNFKLKAEFITAWTSPGMGSEASKETLNPDLAIQVCFKSSAAIFTQVKSELKNILARP